MIPSNFYAAGINYREHIIEMAQKRGEEPFFPPNADVGYRSNNALTGQGDPIIVPKDATELLQYEGELVAVFGKKCKNVSEEEALDYVFGYTIGNDVSERTWQRGDRTMWRARTPIPQAHGSLDRDRPGTRQFSCLDQTEWSMVGEYDVKDAIFSVRHYISRMSQYLTIYPGDVLWMGTDGAPENMKDGDVVEVEINDIGILRNPVVWEK